MDTPDPDAHLRTYFSFLDITALILDAIDDTLRAHSTLSSVQFRILASLLRSPGHTQRMSDLAVAAGTSRSGLTYQVGLLEERALVTRSRTHGDDRGVSVTLTAAGSAAVTAVLPDVIAATHEILYRGLGADESAAMDLLLERMTPRT